MAVSTILDIAAMTPALKELYSGQVVENLVYEDNPFLAMVPKFTEMRGKNYPVPLVYGSPQGRSATFSSAQANMTSPLVQEFLVTRKKDYAVVQIDNETLEASQTDKAAFLEGAKLALDGGFRQATLSLSSALFRSGTGSVAQIGSISTGVITLASPGDVVQFEVNMTLVASATDGGATRGPGTKGFVVAVDTSAGTVTVSTSLGGAAASPAAWATNDFLAVEGDAQAGGTSPLKISGLAAWIPATAPTSTAFYGVDRSAHATRLGGVRYDGSTMSVDEALLNASNLVAREGGRPDTCVMSFGSYTALVLSLGAKIQYIDQKVGEVGFRGVAVNGANSIIKVFPDRSCPANTAYLLTLKSWKLGSMGPAPKILTYPDNNSFLRVGSSDAAEARVGYYGNLWTNAPGWNAYVKLGG